MYLAMAPLAQSIQGKPEQQNKTVLHIANLLQEYYQRRVQDALQTFAPDDTARITASTGIAITHHYTSLAYALRAARDAENTAKKRYGKNSLVVTVVRRSGEQTSVGCKWRYSGLSDAAQPIPLFTRFYELFLQDVLSPKCVHILLEEASILVGLERAAQESEIKRVLLRQLSEKHRTEDAYKTEMKQRAEQLVLLAAQMDEVNTQDKAVALHVDKVRYGLVETLGWLLVMAFLARKDQE